MDILVLAASLPLSFALSYFLGYGGLVFFLVAIGIACLLIFTWIGIAFHFLPPKVQQTWTRGEETVLKLTDKSPHRENGPPTLK